MSSRKGSIASLIRCAISELGSIPLASAIVYSGSARVINGATLLVWESPMTPNPFRPFSFRMWMAVMWSWIFFLSFSRTPHFLRDSRASSIRRPVNSGRGAVVSFLR